MAKNFLESSPDEERNVTAISERWDKMLSTYRFSLLLQIAFANCQVHPGLRKGQRQWFNGSDWMVGPCTINSKEASWETGI